MWQHTRVAVVATIALLLVAWNVHITSQVAKYDSLGIVENSNSGEGTKLEVSNKPDPTWFNLLSSMTEVEMKAWMAENGIGQGSELENTIWEIWNQQHAKNATFHNYTSQPPTPTNAGDKEKEDTQSQNELELEDTVKYMYQLDAIEMPGKVCSPGDPFSLEDKVARNEVAEAVVKVPGSKTARPLEDDLLLYFEDSVESPAALVEELAEVPTVPDVRDLTWVRIYCPEVVAYFTKVSYFDFEPYDVPPLYPPILTTEAAMQSTCLLKIIRDVATQVDAHWFIYAGTHLGAVLHGGPIPWDDDADVAVSISDIPKLERGLVSFRILGAPKFRLGIYHGTNGLKLFVMDHATMKHKYGWGFPFIDIFAMAEITENKKYIGNGHGARIAEIRAKEGTIHMEWEKKELYPLREWFYGGIIVLGPPDTMSITRYSAFKCYTARYNHRVEMWSGFKGKVSCCKLAKAFPFLRRVASKSDSNIEYSFIMVDEETVKVLKFDSATRRYSKPQYVIEAPEVIPHPGVAYSNDISQGITMDLPQEAYDMSFAESTWPITTEMREQWFSNPSGKSGQELTLEVPNLNVVEVDNSVTGECLPFDPAVKGQLTIVEFNAERGIHWLLSVIKITSEPKFWNADIIILNEMDIGMARSRNEHTTRLMAFALGMNYAWGLEFVELTNGDEDEQKATKGHENTLGLHGNAILSKYCLYTPEAVVLRDALGIGYYTEGKSPVNAGGYERRLGGRMGLVVPVVTTADKHFLLGSIHKMNGAANTAAVRSLLSATKVEGGVFAGDQSWGFCDQAGMKHMDIKGQGTWKASLKDTGQNRGDIICASKAFAAREHSAVTIIPSYNTEDLWGLWSLTREWRKKTTEYNTPPETVLLSDHALTVSIVDLNPN